MLDCETPLGAVAIARQNRLLATMATRWHWDVIVPPRKACPVDGLYLQQGRLTTVAEVKARDLTMDGLQAYGSYLITEEKLQQGRALGRCFGVEYRLVAGLFDAIVWWVVADARGDWRVDRRVKKTLTRETVNGGSVWRDNAYVALDAMVVEPHEGTVAQQEDWAERAAIIEEGNPGMTREEAERRAYALVYGYPLED